VTRAWICGPLEDATIEPTGEASRRTWAILAAMREFRYKTASFVSFQSYVAKPPRPPDGSICDIIMHAAGGFSGWTIRVATPDEAASLARARWLRDFAVAAMGSPNPNRKG
jgi:hypothetical protein